MALTINITLTTMHNTPDRDVILLKIVRVIAKQMLTQASLLQDSRAPKIKVTAGDNFNAVTEVKLFDEQGGELDSDIDPAKLKPGAYGLSAIALNTMIKNLEE